MSLPSGGYSDSALARERALAIPLRVSPCLSQGSPDRLARPPYPIAAQRVGRIALAASAGNPTQRLRTSAAVEVTFVKANGPGKHDRAYLTMAGAVRRGPVHVEHDLPHLVVESVLGIDDGLWGELEAGRHDAAARAATSRDPKRQKAGRIVSGAAEGAPTAQWLTAGHRTAKTLTNAVANRFGDGPDTPAGVRHRVARSGDRSAQLIVSAIDDETIARAIVGVAEALRRWAALPAGESLRLAWPLA